MNRVAQRVVVPVLARLRERGIEVRRIPVQSAATESESRPVRHVEKLDFVATYEAHTSQCLAQGVDRAQALQRAVGVVTDQEFVATGKIQRDLLVDVGLTDDMSVIEIGCGAGRLALPLSKWLTGPYLGVDVVQDLVDHAAALAGRPDWRFELVDGLAIPAADESADIVCAFSVFTHLLHEESYRYLEDCRRVLRPGGRIVFSFLEFRVPSHWDVMESNLAALGSTQVHNQFMSVDAVEAWSEHLGVKVLRCNRGDEPYIPLSEPVSWENASFETLATLGQSTAVLVKL